MNTVLSILVILTSASEMSPQEPTGIWLEEFAVPYLAFKQQGLDVTIVSIKGGKAPIDPRSDPSAEDKEAWADAIAVLDNTALLSSVDAADYDAVFIPGGHGTMFDLPKSDDLTQLLNSFAQQDKVIAAVCHGPAGLVNVTTADGAPLVAGKKVTGFTNEEEAATGLAEKMPFLLESRLRELGANFIGQENWSDNVVVDGNLITGQMKSIFLLYYCIRYPFPFFRVR